MTDPQLNLSDDRLLELYADKDAVANMDYDQLLDLQQQVSRRHKQTQTDLANTPYNKADNTAREKLVQIAFPLGYFNHTLQVRLARDSIIGMLLDAGITHAIAEYDGYGDEGWFRTAQFWMGAAESPDLTYNAEYSHGSEEAAPVDSPAAFFIDYAQELIEVFHPGYENNDGGQGQVVFDIDEGIRIDHGYNYTATEEEVTKI